MLLAQVLVRQAHEELLALIQPERLLHLSCLG
jgi:hypothetical protein